MHPDTATCLDCGARLLGPYCHRCGQEASERVVPLRRILGDALGDLFAFDSRVWRTMRLLFARPGFLTAEWRRGRRARYVPPLRLYVFVAALFFLILGWTDVRMIEMQTQPVAGAEFSGERVPTTEELAAEVAAGQREASFLIRTLLALETLGEEELQGELLDRLGRLSLLLPPYFALLAMLVYRRRRYYVEHLTFSLHLHAFVFLVLGTVVLLPEDVGAWQGTRQAVAVFGAIPALVAYLVLAAREAYGGRTWTTLVRTGGLGLVYVVTALPLVFFLALAWVVQGL